jgi:predicted DNA-binding ribbon-helix-helix protein
VQNEARLPLFQVRVVKRSIRIARHNTSISLEPEFWAELKDIAAHDGLSINQVVAQVDAARSTNLSSALRLYVLKRLKDQK